MARIAGRTSDDTRRGVVAAASEAFATHGFAASSLGRIARSAGVTAATLSYHFGGKEGLYRAVIDDVYEDLAGLQKAVLASRVGGQQVSLDQLIDRAYAYAESRKTAIRLLLRDIMERGGLDPGFREERVLPSLTRTAALLATVFDRPVAETRAAVVTLTHLAVRYAMSPPEDNRTMLGVATDAEARETIVSTLTRTARALLDLPA